MLICPNGRHRKATLVTDPSRENVSMEPFSRLVREDWTIAIESDRDRKNAWSNEPIPRKPSIGLPGNCNGTDAVRGQPMRDHVPGLLVALRWAY